MADNFHGIDDEIEEQDKIIEDLANLTTIVNTNTTNISNIDVATINAKLAGTSSSGLKTLITGNDTDIANIQTKTDFISVSQNVDLDQMESNIATNNAKVGITATEQGKLSNISVSSSVNLNTMNTNITTNTNAIDAIELKTDFISVSQNVDLDTMESNIATNNAKTGITSQQATDITNNNAKIGFPSTLNSLLSVSDTYELEVGSGSGVPRIRLNGANGNATSSEIIFVDATGNNPEYFQGAGIRFNSSDNKLQFITDQGNDGVAEIQMSINRSDGFIGIKDTTPSFELDVNGEINAMKQYHYYQSGIPMIIGITSIHSQLVSYHRLGYGNGANNGSGSITENTFFQPHTDFKVVFRPFSSKVFIDIKFVMDRYFSGRNLVWALGTSSSASSIIGRTLTFHRSADSEWTTRQEVVRLHDQGFTPYTSYIRYIFVKSIVVNSDNSIGSTGGNTGWILFGGWNTHSNGGGQTTGHYQTDTTPHLPTNNDNFGPLEAIVYGVPDSFTTSASTSNPLQYIGY